MSDGPPTTIWEALTDDEQASLPMEGREDDGDDETVRDPCSVLCSACGTAHHIDAATGEYLGRCRECSAYLPRPEEWQERLFHKRMEQTVLHEEGYVTVGGYIESVHGGDDE